MNHFKHTDKYKKTTQVSRYYLFTLALVDSFSFFFFKKQNTVVSGKACALSSPLLLSPEVTTAFHNCLINSHQVLVSWFWQCAETSGVWLAKLRPGPCPCSLHPHPQGTYSSRPPHTFTFL